MKIHETDIIEKVEDNLRDCLQRVPFLNSLQNPQKQAKVKALEAEIDQLVYKLYDLTEEEIGIVEGRSKTRGAN